MTARLGVHLLDQPLKTLVQCDFDGTVTVEDVSFMLLDRFAEGDWRCWEQRYAAGEVSVGRFNSAVFRMVRADRETMLAHVRNRVVIRPGFHEFVRFCQEEQHHRLVIASNGLDFYVQHILEGLGMSWVEAHAARTTFLPGRLQVKYVGPDGTVLDHGFKTAYTRRFLEQGYRVLYIGDGASDFEPASLCHRVFAVADAGSLLTRCRKAGVACEPFSSFHDVIRAMRCG